MFIIWYSCSLPFLLFTFVFVVSSFFFRSSRFLLFFLFELLSLLLLSLQLLLLFFCHDHYCCNYYYHVVSLFFLVFLFIILLENAQVSPVMFSILIHDQHIYSRCCRLGVIVFVLYFLIFRILLFPLSICMNNNNNNDNKVYLFNVPFGYHRLWTIIILHYIYYIYFYHKDGIFNSVFSGSYRVLQDARWKISKKKKSLFRERKIYIFLQFTNSVKRATGLTLLISAKTLG